ncbi:MAG: exodeoxyribonuclease VII large subunit [SAR202 cluster bacterium]|nr:MAG: exodeoxyribonuclease VII large subunit [SAR202 cluster bacterium]
MEAVSVSDALAYLSALLASDELLSDVCIRGEVSRCTRAASGHSYFTLKDEQSVLESVLFKGGLGQEHLEVGDEVFAFGRVNVYVPQGRLQLVAEYIKPAGAGELQARFEEMREKLSNEGLFSESRKRKPVEFPKFVGVVTSKDAAAWLDIQRTVTDRFPLVELVLAHTPVQGDGAAETIASALALLGSLPEIDTIIVARGGGSPEDLWPFNEEVVARAIFASPVPVVSGVGHETDWSISDLVADVRASTPTMAAMMVVPDSDDLNNSLELIVRNMDSSVRNGIAGGVNQLNSRVSIMNSNIPDVSMLRVRVDELGGRIHLGSMRDLLRASESLGNLKNNLKAVGPQHTLERGYSIVEKSDDGKVVTNISHVTLGDEVKITVSDGAFEGDVSRKIENLD